MVKLEVNWSYMSTSSTGTYSENRAGFPLTHCGLAAGGPGSRWSAGLGEGVVLGVCGVAVFTGPGGELSSSDEGVLVGVIGVSGDAATGVVLPVCLGDPGLLGCMPNLFRDRWTSLLGVLKPAVS